MARAWLSLGANLGDAAGQIEQAIAMLDATVGVRVTARSTSIVTPAWGRTHQPDFHNAAIEVETALPPLALLDGCQAVEASLRRERREYWGPRRIDIDIVAYERLVLRALRLTLPHPWAHERAFVLDPLREIAPDVVDWLLTTGDIGA